MLHVGDTGNLVNIPSKGEYIVAIFLVAFCNRKQSYRLTASIFFVFHYYFVGDHPLVAQFAASNPKDFADAAEIVAP